jgi:hypothetical protein
MRACVISHSMESCHIRPPRGIAKSPGERFPDSHDNAREDGSDYGPSADGYYEIRYPGIALCCLQNDIITRTGTYAMFAAVRRTRYVIQRDKEAKYGNTRK